jgi:hypothetical protein
MWTDAGIAQLAAVFPPDGSTIGLYVAGAEHPEMTAIIGVYRPASCGQWRVTPQSGGWMLSCADVTFTGFVSRAGAIGWLLLYAGAVLCAAPFADGKARNLVEVDDQLIVTPQLLLQRTESS